MENLLRQDHGDPLRTHYAPRIGNNRVVVGGLEDTRLISKKPVQRTIFNPSTGTTEKVAVYYPENDPRRTTNMKFYNPQKQ